MVDRPEAGDPGLPPLDVAQRLLAEDANLVASLEGVAAAGCALLDGCSSASITIIQRGRPHTLAATGDLADDLDRAQYDADEGPCLEAARTQGTIVVRDLEAARRWPVFAETGERVGLGSSLSVPLVLSAPETFGGLNCYGKAPDAFDASDRELAERFAAQASAVVANALAYWETFDQAANLAKAMEHRAVIEQAKGILMATQRCSADAAFDLLRRASQRENRKLRDVAMDIVTRTIRAEAP